MYIYYLGLLISQVIMSKVFITIFVVSISSLTDPLVN
jgi:hypothetical protein